MEQGIVTLAAQFGAAGLIAWMWLTERRHSAARERHLTESHERLLEQRIGLEQLLRVVGENTAALGALEAGQQRIADALDRLIRRNEVGEAA